MTQPATVPRIRFLALGPARLEAPDDADAASVLQRPKLLALFSYLAAASPAGLHRRDTLLSLLWPEMDQERARAALRQSLYYLRQYLGDDVVVTRGDEEVGIAPDLVWRDVVAFDDALARGAREEALEVYAGDFLEGFLVAGAPEFERWIDQRREELRRRARHAAWELAQRADGAGSVAAAAHWARQSLRLAGYDEDVLRQVISLLDRLGDRAGAVREFELFARRLRADLDLEPAPETRALVESIRARDAVTGRPPESDAGYQAPSSPPGPPPPSPAVGRPGRSRQRRIAVLGGAILTLVVVALLVSRFVGGAAPAADAHRVVVAVFENLTGDPALDPLGRMATDWITQGLDQLTVINVVPSTSGLIGRPDLRSQGGAGSGDLRALARATGARTVVTGTYYRTGDSLGFQAQVVDARSGRLLRAVPPVVGPRDASGAIIDTLRQYVIGTVATLFDSRITLFGDARPPSLDAYRAYLEGYRAFQRVPPQMREALVYLKQAVDLDSAFLDPRFFLVFTDINLGDYAAADSSVQYLVRRRARMTPRQGRMLDWQLALVRGDRGAALQAARAAVGRLDVGREALRSNHLHEAVRTLSGAPGLSEALYPWLALMDAYHMLGDYDRELREAQRARRRYPAYREVLDAWLRALAALGRVDEAERGLDEGLLHASLGSLTATAVTLNLAAELRAHGHREASLALADRVIAGYGARPAADTASAADRFRLGNAYYLRERWADARAVFRSLAALSPGNVNYMGFLGVLAARMGQPDVAAAISDSLTGRATGGDFGRDLYWQACIAAQLGQRGPAMELLREAYARGRAFTVLLHRDMDLEPLRQYPPYLRFVRSRD
jgi:DNA-binding SARP family transcriptional activator/TolB-like protein/tetratricopeptide (TPR) repeat protein